MGASHQGLPGSATHSCSGQMSARPRLLVVLQVKPLSCTPPRLAPRRLAACSPALPRTFKACAQSVAGCAHPMRHAHGLHVRTPPHRTSQPLLQLG